MSWMTQVTEDLRQICLDNVFTKRVSLMCTKHGHRKHLVIRFCVHSIRLQSVPARNSRNFFWLWKIRIFFERCVHTMNSQIQNPRIPREEHFSICDLSNLFGILQFPCIVWWQRISTYLRTEANRRRWCASHLEYPHYLADATQTITTLGKNLAA